MAIFANRHYEAVATTVQEAKRRSVTENECIGVATVMHNLADMFADDNVMFKRDRFIAACQPGAGVGKRT